MYCYVRALDQDRLLVWYQGYDSKLCSERNTIDFHFLKVTDLKPIEDVEASIKALIEKEKYFVANSDKAKLFSLTTDLEPGIHSISFGNEFDFTDELLLWGHSTVESFLPQWGKNSNLCLFVIRPQSRILEVFRPDWFNNSDDLDFGYQWVTRVAREPKSGRVYGDGIRIPRFVLDDSLRGIEKWFYDDP